jgi:hypothetical protein
MEEAPRKVGKRLLTRTPRMAVNYSLMTTTTHPSPQSGETTDHAVDAQLAAPMPGHFGPYGGKFVPETIMVALRELECVYEEAKQDAAFRDELSALLPDAALLRRASDGALRRRENLPQARRFAAYRRA